MRSTIFIGLMLTGGLATASFMREDAPTDAVVAMPIVRTNATPARSDLPVLPLDRLTRSTALEPEGNPFANKSWYVPPPLPPVVETLKVDVPAQPVAPRLPFVYMGRIQEEGGKPVVFLTQGLDALSVSIGDEINGAYRLESISPTQLVFTYLPLNISQTMTVGNDLSTMDDSVASARDVMPDPSDIEGR